MAGRAGKNKKVPDKMAVADAMGSEENQGAGIGNPAGQEQDHRVPGQRHDKGPGREEKEPYHAEEKNQRQFLPPYAGSKFYDLADNGEEPDEHEERPAQGAAHRA